MGVWCSCGGVSSVHLPLVVVVGGAFVCGGACVVVVGGMVSEGRLCCWPPRLRVGVPLTFVLAPLSCLLGGRVEWREWCVVMPRVWIGSGISCCPAPLLYCPALRVFVVTALLV